MPALHFTWCKYQAKKEPALCVVRNRPLAPCASTPKQALATSGAAPGCVGSDSCHDAVPAAASAPRCDSAGRDTSGSPAQHRRAATSLSCIIPCTAGAGRLLAGTPEVVVCFQSCCDGQNLASPGRAAWAGCLIHPLPASFPPRGTCGL